MYIFKISQLCVLQFKFIADFCIVRIGLIFWTPLIVLIFDSVVVYYFKMHLSLVLSPHFTAGKQIYEGGLFLIEIGVHEEVGSMGHFRHKRDHLSIKDGVPLSSSPRISVFIIVFLFGFKLEEVIKAKN